jgi:hypothetical protein
LIIGAKAAQNFATSTSWASDKAQVLTHKAVTDAHLQQIGIPVSYTNVFWGGRSEIKPSEISPLAHREWSTRVGLDPKD